MINWLLIYGILMGLLLRLVNHGKLVVAGQPCASTAKRLLGLWRRLMIIAFIIIQGFHLYWLWPYTYNEWWAAYWVEHSPMAFILVTCPITLALYLLKEITYHVSRHPHGFQDYDPGTRAPTLFKVNMRVAFIWYGVYWAWLLFSPWLPFYKCFVHSYLLHQRVVFSMFWTLQ